jgi:hypothetical protein
VALIDRRQALVQDDIEGAAGSEITWQMHTRAKIELDGSRAVLSQGGKRLVARLLAPAGAAFSTAAASAPPPQRQQPDVTKLIVKVPGSEKSIRLAVVFAADGKDAKTPALVPLETWTNGPRQ